MTKDKDLRQLSDAVLAMPPKLCDIDHYKFTLPNEVTCCSSFYDNRRLVVCGRSDSVTSVIDLWAKKQIDLRGHSGPVFAASYLYSSEKFLTGGRDRTIRLWNPEKFLTDPEEVISMEYIYRGHTGHVTSIATMPPFDFYFGSTGTDHSTRLWCVESRVSWIYFYLFILVIIDNINNTLL